MIVVEPTASLRDCITRRQTAELVALAVPRTSRTAVLARFAAATEKLREHGMLCEILDDAAARLLIAWAPSWLNPWTRWDGTPGEANGELAEPGEKH